MDSNIRLFAERIRRTGLCALLISLALGVLTGCRKGGDWDVIRVGIRSGPCEQLMEVAAKVALQRYGLKIKSIPFTDYAVPNAALADGSLDANMMQHQPYLDAAVASRGYALTSIGKTFVYPMGVYSKKVKNLAQLGGDIVVAVPNDPSNETRALLLLERAGLFELDPASRADATPRAIHKLQKNVKVKELDAAQLVRALDDVDIAAINTNYAVAAELYPEPRWAICRAARLALRQHRRRQNGTKRGGAIAPACPSPSIGRSQRDCGAIVQRASHRGVLRFTGRRACRKNALSLPTGPGWGGFKLRELARGRAVIALDGAINHLHRMLDDTMRVDAIVGDLDSVKKGLLSHYESIGDVAVVKDPDQTTTDLEKGIVYCDQVYGTNITIVNAFGVDRLDHTLANLNLMKKYASPTRRMRLVTTSQVVEFVSSATISFPGKSGDAVGVFGFPRGTVRKSLGLRYPLAGLVVETGEGFSSSNYVELNEEAPRPTGPELSEVSLTIEGDALVTYAVSAEPVL